MNAAAVRMQVGTESRHLSPAPSTSEPAAAELLGAEEIEAFVQSAINNGAFEAALNAVLQDVNYSSPGCGPSCSRFTVDPAESLQVSTGRKMFSFQRHELYFSAVKARIESIKW